MPFFRRFSVVLLMTFAFSQALVQPLIYIEYEIRKEYIITEFCKERFATINTCDGRCFIVNKLNATQQKESEEKERNIRPVEINLSCTLESTTVEKPLPTLIDSTYNRFAHSCYSFLFEDTSFRPPRV